MRPNWEAMQQDKGDLVEQNPHRYLNKLFIHRNFTFDDDMWDLNFRATGAVAPSRNKLSFEAFPSSAKYDVKNFIALTCWGAGLSNSSMQAILSVLKQTIVFFKERYKGNFSLIKLTLADATALEEHFSYLTNQYTKRQYIACVARFAAFLREQHEGEPANFRPDPHSIPLIKSKGKPYSQGLEHVIPDEVSTALIEAVHCHNIFLKERTKIFASEQLSSDHLYLVVLILLLFSGRRVSEVLLLRRNCLREPTAEEMTITGPGIWLAYDNTKSHLKQKEIFIPGPAVQLIREQVAHVQEWTEKLFQESKLDHLFLTNWQTRGKIRTLTINAFASWLSGDISENGRIYRAGFIHRYNIKYQGEYYYLNPHQTRHTLAYKAYMGGASYVEVGDHLDHLRTSKGISPITGVYLHGQEKDVQLIREMYERRLVTGKALPILSNRSIVVQNLNPSDVAIWREQGMMLHPTHYGQCILPENSGPCVCGDPCWIGPQGDGCDYAFYTPESKKNLLEDRAILLLQVEDLKKSNPRHPRLGQWEARIDRLDQVLSEITEAERQAVNNESPDRPRYKLVPHDPPFEAQLPQIPAKPLPRRKATSPSIQKKRNNAEQAQGLEANILKQADIILQELNQRKVPISIQSLARRLGIKTHVLYTCASICDRLAQHNKQYSTPIQEVIEMQFNNLQTLRKTATRIEFAEMCGFSSLILFKHYPEWKQKLKFHNIAVQNTILYEKAKKHLADLITDQRCETLRDFAKYIGTDSGTLTKQYPDIVEKVLHHNRNLGLRGSLNHASEEDRIAHIYACWNKAREAGKHFTLTEFSDYCSLAPGTIRTLCPELLPQLCQPGERQRKKTEAALAQAFAEIKQSGEIKTVKDFTAMAGIKTNNVSEYYNPWVVQLYKHNDAIREAKLQEAWTRMEYSGKAWSIKKFAEEAEINCHTFRKSYPDWCDRLRNHLEAEIMKRNQEITWQLNRMLEEASQVRTFLMPSEAAKKVGLEYYTFKKHFSNVLKRITEYNEKTFRPIVDEAWREVIASGECPTLAEFAQCCGLQHYAILQIYFPEVVEKLYVFREQGNKK